MPHARPLQPRGRRCSLAGSLGVGPGSLKATNSTTLLAGGPAASASYAPAEHLRVANLSPPLMKDVGAASQSFTIPSLGRVRRGDETQIRAAVQHAEAARGSWLLPTLRGGRGGKRWINIFKLSHQPYETGTIILSAVFSIFNFPVLWL